MENLRELQLVELEILKEVLKYFRENNIQYYALGGTMLGAVRHKGFIPWDDDIDIGVPREDYEKLIAGIDTLPNTMKLCAFSIDENYNYYFARIIDTRYEVRSNRSEKDEVTNAWIDIFPLDGMPNDRIMRRLHGWRILLCRLLFQTSRFDAIVNIKRQNRPLYEKLVIWCITHLGLQRLINKKWAFDRLDIALKKYPYSRSDFNINAMGAYKLKEMFVKSVFGEGMEYQFEDIEIIGPEKADEYLTQLYGDWRTPADFEHHSVVEIQKQESNEAERNEGLK